MASNVVLSVPRFINGLKYLLSTRTPRCIAPVNRSNTPFDRGLDPEIKAKIRPLDGWAAQQRAHNFREINCTKKLQYT